MMGFGGFGSGFGFLFMILFWGLIIWLIVWIVQQYVKPKKGKRQSPIEILNSRLARGEITTAEYDKLKKKIGR
ncbi:SHOCT domain-containing protein [Candidatus Woesearchaeota archaeon]|nr:SHOCT domain-containing protein [Candidatus Woesearchaeota archaeon]